MIRPLEHGEFHKTRIIAVRLLATLAVGGSACKGGPTVKPGPSTIAIPELSGLVASSRDRRVFWGQADSGNANHVYRVTLDVETTGTLHWSRPVAFEVVGSENQDWEDLAIDPEDNLYVGDIGNNFQLRRDLVVYRVPTAASDSATAGRLHYDRAMYFDYPDRDTSRNFDSESLAWFDGRLHLATKHRSDTRTVLYRFPDFSSDLGRSSKQPAALERRGEFDVGGSDHPYGGMTTAMDVSPDGRSLALLTYHAILVFDRSDGAPAGFGQLLRNVGLDSDQVGQNEAVAWLDDDRLIIANEAGQSFLMHDPRTTTLERFPPAATPVTASATR